MFALVVESPEKKVYTNVCVCVSGINYISSV